MEPILIRPRLPRRRKAQAAPPASPEVFPEILSGAAPAARFLGVSLSTLYRELERGLPHRRVGRRLLFSRAELVRWVASPGAVGPEGGR